DPQGAIPARKESGAPAPFARMRFFLIGLLILGSLLAAPSLHAQQAPGPRIVLDPEPLDLPAFRLSPLDALFVSKPFATWLDEWTAPTRARLAREQGRRLLANRFTTPQDLADTRAAQEAAALDTVIAAELLADTVAPVIAGVTQPAAGAAPLPD